MNIFTKIVKSVYGPDFYRDLSVKKFSFSLKYFFVMIFFFALVASGIFYATRYGDLKNFFQSVGPQILEYYPDELEIYIKNGKASTNVQEPYFMDFPNAAKSELFGDGVQSVKLLVIDTDVPFSIQKFEEYNSIAWLTEDSLVYRKNVDKNLSQSSYTVMPLNNISDFAINERIISTLLREIKPLLEKMPLIFVWVALPGFYFIGISHLAYLLFGALLVWLVAKAQKINVGYKTAYRYGLHMITLPLFLSLIIPFKYQVHFVFSVILIIIAALNLNQKTFGNIPGQITQTILPTEPPATPPPTLPA